MINSFLNKSLSFLSAYHSIKKIDITRYQRNLILKYRIFIFGKKKHLKLHTIIN